VSVEEELRSVGCGNQGSEVGIEVGRRRTVNAQVSDDVANFMVISEKNGNTCGWLKVVHTVQVGFGAAREDC
jgi:hypothetical protein